MAVSEEKLAALAAARHGQEMADLLGWSVQGDRVAVILANGQKYIYPVSDLIQQEEDTPVPHKSGEKRSRVKNAGR